MLHAEDLPPSRWTHDTEENHDPALMWNAGIGNTQCQKVRSVYEVRNVCYGKEEWGQWKDSIADESFSGEVEFKQKPKGYNILPRLYGEMESWVTPFFCSFIP